MNEKDAYIKQLENKIDDLQIRVEQLTEMLLLLRKEKFGASSEKTPKADIFRQLSLFHETEAEVSVLEPIKKEVTGYTRTRRKTKREELTKDLPVREVICDVPEEDQFCLRCGTSLRRVGKETVREELEYIPAKLQIVRYVRWAYECPVCKHTNHPYIKKAKTPTSLMNHSLASPSAAAHVMYEKYVNAVPLYRQEKDWERLGIRLSRAVMANWIIRCTEEYIKPITDYFHKQLLAREIIHCDETPIQVLKEDGRKPQTTSYMWLYRTGSDGKAPIILYEYQPSRNGDHAVKFLEGFKGYVQCDGYSGYNKLKDMIRCGCWVHLRRKFIEAIPAKKASNITLTAAEIGRDYCNQLFRIEKEVSGFSAEKRYHKRLEREKPILKAFWCWLENLTVLKGSALGTAVAYAKNQKPYMENYLLDGRLSLSNNAAENAIRPFTVGQKNWLFSDTPKGASASAAVYSIVETAKANGLDVYKYLQYLLQCMPDLNWRNDPAVLDRMMPWADAVQSGCSR